ncbi:MAG: RNA methyltransferase, partial [Armatimonadota bacterium]
DSYERITSLKHPAVRLARALLTPAGRAAAQQFLIEGEAMVEQALAVAGACDVFVLEGAKVGASLRSTLAAAGTRCYTVSRGLMTKILGTGYDTSTTTVAVAPMRLASTESLVELGGPLLVCERIQDPRNIGVLLRTADAGGARGMLLGPDSAEPFSRAAVRSSTGSILRLPLALSRDLLADLSLVRQSGLRLIATSAHGRTPVQDAGLDRSCAIIVGNESEGVSSEARAFADDVVAIPVAGQASSFNVTVAAGVLLYECLRAVRDM